MKDLHVDQQTLAKVFRVSTRTIQRWEKDGLDRARVEEEATSALYDLPDAVAWRVEEEVRRVTEPSDNGDAPDLQESRARKEAALAELRELEVGERRGELLPTDIVEAQWRDHLVRFQAAVRAAPNRYVNMAICECRDAPDAHALLEKIFAQWRDDFREEELERLEAEAEKLEDGADDA